MSVITHIDYLKAKHHDIEKRIHDAYSHHLPVADLKKRRLHIRDQIEFYSIKAA